MKRFILDVFLEFLVLLPGIITFVLLSKGEDNKK